VSVLGPVALLGGCSDAVQVDAPEPAADDRAACRALLAAVPDNVADQPARAVEPDSAWGAAWGDPPIVLTCGGPPPKAFDRTSSCTTVNDVDWFIPEEQLDDPSPSEVTMTVVYRRPTVTVQLPGDYWPPATTLADLSAAVAGNTQRDGSCV
jgi:hypothetical protein